MTPKKEYYIPALVVGAVHEKRAKDPRLASRKPPLYRAYICILEIGLDLLETDDDFLTAVLSNWMRVDEGDRDCWQRVNLPVYDELHNRLKQESFNRGRRFYDFVHALMLEAVRHFEYSDLHTPGVQVRA